MYVGLWVFIVVVLGGASTSLSQFTTDFYGLNKTCHQTWSMFETTFNLSKISRIDFIQGLSCCVVDNKNFQTKIYFKLGNELEMCDKSEGICCNRMLERNLSLLSLRQYRKMFLSKSLLPLRTNLINYVYNFDSTFKY